MFLGVTADVASWNADATAFSLLLYDNPLIGESRLNAVQLPHSVRERDSVRAAVTRSFRVQEQRRFACCAHRALL